VEHLTPIRVDMNKKELVKSSVSGRSESFATKDCGICIDSLEATVLQAFFGKKTSVAYN